MSPWWPLLGLLSWYPIFASSDCNSFEDQAIIDFIYSCLILVWVNTLRPRQDGRHFPDDIFKCIFLNENVWISLKIWLKFVPKVPMNNIPAMVQIMAWRRSGDKPLSEPMMISLLTHICVTRSQWVNSSPPSATCMHQWTVSALVQIMACRLFGAKPLSITMLGYRQLDP